MKKNLKNCMVQFPIDTPALLVDMDRPGVIEVAGMLPDTVHQKSASRAAAWRFGEKTSVRMTLKGGDISSYRYLTLSVFAVQGVGGSFSLFFDCGRNEKNGYACTLPILRDGWNDYRIELPFVQAVGDPKGWASVCAIVLDCARGGQSNRTETVLYFDNFYGWESFAPPVYSTAPELKGAAVFSKGGSFAIVDRKKIASSIDGSDAAPFERDGVLWIPMAPVAAGIAHAAVADNLAWTLNFTYRRKKYEFCGLSDQMVVDGIREPLGFTPAAKNGTLFFPVEFVKNFFHWRQCYVDPMGLVVLSNRKSIYDPVRDETLVWQLIADTTFVRPDGERVVNDMRRVFPNPARGKLLASFDQLMQLRKLAKSDKALGDYVKALKALYGEGSVAYAQPVVGMSADEHDLRSCADVLLGFAMLYRVTGDKIYAERTAVEIEALAALSDWSLGSNGLFGTLILSVAIAYDWCRHTWSEGRKALIERAVLRNALRPMLDVYDGNGEIWRLGSVTGAVVNAGVLALSLAFADSYPQTSYKLLDRVLRNVEPSFALLAPDGGSEIGASAWETTARALALIVAMLQTACGTDYGLGSAPGFAATAYFPIYAETANGAWNYHDAPNSRFALDTSMQFFFAKHNSDPVLAWMHRQEILSGRKPVRPFDILFYESVDDTITPHLPLDCVWRRAGLAVMRAGWAPNSAVIGLHGGCNRVPSADLDAGSVILEMGGERFFAETGGERTLPTLLRRRAEGQNTWVINPTEEPLPDQNPDANARLVEMRSTVSMAYAVADMTTTNDLLLRAKRGVMLTENRTVAVIQDELTLAEPTDLVWSAWTRADVKLNASGRSAILTQNGKRLACKLCGIGSPARFAVKTVEGSDWKALTVSVENKDKIRMAVVCRLLADGEKATEKVYDVIPMNRWGE